MMRFISMVSNVAQASPVALWVIIDGLSLKYKSEKKNYVATQNKGVTVIIYYKNCPS